jgi:CRISPR-associated endoribonuclease Cas6
MRLLIKLRCLESSGYEMHYHYHLQGFIYNLLRDSKYDYIHNKKGYKFFCFSNIFPITNVLKKNSIYNLLLSSPSNEIVKDVCETMIRLQKMATEINIGHMKFSINSVAKVSVATAGVAIMFGFLGTLTSTII